MNGRIFTSALILVMAICTATSNAHANPIMTIFNHTGTTATRENEPMIDFAERLRFFWNKPLAALDGIANQKFKKPVRTCAQFVKTTGGEISSSVTYAAPSPLGDYDLCAVLSAIGWAKKTQSALFYDQYDSVGEYSQEQDILDHLDLSTLPLGDAWGLKGRGPVFFRDLAGAKTNVEEEPEMRSLEITYRDMALTLTEDMAADFEDRGDQQELIDYQIVALKHNRDAEERDGFVLLSRDTPRGTMTANPIRIRTPRSFKTPDYN